MKRELCQEIVGLLRYHETLGIHGYPFSQDVRRFLEESRHPAMVQGVIDRAADAPACEKRRVSSESRERNIAAAAATLAKLQQEIISCQQCDIGEKGWVPVVPEKPGKVKLMVIGDWPRQVSATKDVFFGYEEDVMLAKMLKAIQLEYKDVCITNVMRCKPYQDIQPRSEHISTCAVFLKKQIEILAPVVLCAMGNVAARVLYNSGVPLSRMRGRFHHYTCGSRTFPLMVTYHPSYLLKNPEMKRATWTDLQLVQKKLRELQQ